VSVKKDEWGAVGEWMWEHRNEFNGISVLPYDGGTYVQAPFEDLDKNDEKAVRRFEEMESALDDIDLTQVRETEDNTDLTGEVACGPAGCEVT
jgi:ribonucleoside-diphosphate reductase alpha chain